MLYTWADALLALAVVLTTAAVAAIAETLYRRRRARMRDLERTLRVGRYAEPPRVDLWPAIVDHLRITYGTNDALSAVLAAVAVSKGLTITPTLQRTIGAYVALSRAARSLHEAGLAIDIPTTTKELA